MILLTCSSYSAEIYRLFDTFRQHNSNDKMIWILADTNPLSIEEIRLIKEYYGNMDIVSKAVNYMFWQARPCLHHPQWIEMAQIAHSIPDDEIIIRCDANDVVIQKKCDFDNVKDDIIYCGYEGMLYKDNNCCLGWFDNAKKEAYKDKPVINSGVLIANGKTFKKLTAEMAYGNNPGIYCDQNGVNWTCDKIGIKLINNINILAAYNNKYYVNSKLLLRNGNVVAIAHFNGRHMFEHLRNTMQELFSTEKCLAIEKQILGYNI